MVTAIPGQVYALHTTVREFMATAIEQRQAMLPLGRSFTNLYQPGDRGQNKRRPCLVLNRQQVVNTNMAVVNVAFFSTLFAAPSSPPAKYSGRAFGFPPLN